MTETFISCLTPPGSAAIATLALRGPQAWPLVKRFFRPQSKTSLPEEPRPGDTWYGRLGEGAGDEVLIAVPPSRRHEIVEIHCHGGRQVVRWLIDLFLREGCHEVTAYRFMAGIQERADTWELLAQAKTLRTASILLDQANGAFSRALQEIQKALEANDVQAAENRLRDLLRHFPVGLHLLEAWHVVIVGAPNAGKSSLLNALAGYQRSIVTPLAGTTRDVVSTTLAFDGWLVELSDTAGLRETNDLLEKEGVERARRQMAEADLCLWVIDATDPQPSSTSAFAIEMGVAEERILPVMNKMDLPVAWDVNRFTDATPISCLTGVGLEALIQKMVQVLVPDPPAPGTAVPYSGETCAFLKILEGQLASGQVAEAIAGLRTFQAAA